MKIAIDLDGVVFDTENQFRASAQLFDLRIGGGGEENREEVLVQKRFNWNSKQIDLFINEYLEKTLKNAPIMIYAQQIIQILAKKHDLFIITNRGKMGKVEIEITNKRLKEENINVFKKIYYYDGVSKADRCKELGIDLLIDDSFDNVSEVAKIGVKCLYYCDLVKKTFNNQLIYEVRNWGDIARYLVNSGIIKKSDLFSVQNTEDKKKK